MRPGLFPCWITFTALTPLPPSKEKPWHQPGTPSGWIPFPIRIVHLGSKIFRKNVWSKGTDQGWHNGLWIQEWKTGPRHTLTWQAALCRCSRRVRDWGFGPTRALQTVPLHLPFHCPGGKSVEDLGNKSALGGFKEQFVMGFFYQIIVSHESITSLVD